MSKASLTAEKYFRVLQGGPRADAYELTEDELLEVAQLVQNGRSTPGPLHVRMYPIAGKRVYGYFRELNSCAFMIRTAAVSGQTTSGLTAKGVSFEFCGVSPSSQTPSIARELSVVSGAGRRAAVAFAAFLLSALALFGPARDGVSMDPPWQTVVGVEITVAAVFLTLLALYSVVAHNLVSSDHDLLRAGTLDTALNDDRVMVQLTVYGVALSFGGLCLELLATKDWTREIPIEPIAHLVVALAAACIAIPVSDTASFLIERNRMYSQLSLLRADVAGDRRTTGLQ